MMNGVTPENNGGFFSPNGFQNTLYTPPAKEKYALTKNDFVFAVISVFVCIAAVIFGLWGGFKLGFTVSYVALFALMTAFLFNKETRISLFGALSGIFALLTSLVFTFSLNVSVNFFLIIVNFCLSAVWFASLAGIKDSGRDMGLIAHVFITTFGGSFGKIDKTWRSVFNNENTKTKGAGKAVIGIACALPLLLVIVPMLAAADGAFEGFLDYIGERLGTLVLQITIGLFITPFLVSYGYSLKKETYTQKTDREYKGIDNAYVVSFLSVISLVYMAYLFSQLAYFFDAFKGLLPEGGFTPSTYARRGFFEMSIIAGINFAVIYIALLLSKKNEGKPSKSVGIVATFIILFTLLLIATALAKMFLYIENYGMTQLRVTTSAFMIFLAVVFFALIFRCFMKKVPVLRIALIAAACVLLTLGFMNVEATVSRYNVAAYKDKKLETIDVYTIASLRLGGVEALYDVYLNVPEYSEEAEKHLVVLAKKYYVAQTDESGKEIYKRRRSEIGDWNFTSEKAYDILAEFNGK